MHPVILPLSAETTGHARQTVHAPSRDLVTGLGFIEVGTQWDEEDGEETIFERAATQI
jgi:hypothetical protein